MPRAARQREGGLGGGPARPRAAPLAKAAGALGRRAPARGPGARDRAGARPSFCWTSPSRTSTRSSARRAREELEQFQKRIGTTTVYVTHDQVEAMAMGDRIVVMNLGRVRQIGTPADVYDDPADTFVATFLGSPPMNLARDARSRHRVPSGAPDAGRRRGPARGERGVCGCGSCTRSTWAPSGSCTAPSKTGPSPGRRRSRAIPSTHAVTLPAGRRPRIRRSRAPRADCSTGGRVSRRDGRRSR